MQPINIYVLKNWKKDMLSHCPHEADRPAFEKAIYDLLDPRVETRQPLKKKNFSGKVLYTMNFNLNGGAHRFIFERLVLDSKKTIFVLRSVAFNHDYRKALGFQALQPFQLEDFENICPNSSGEVTVDIDETESFCVQYHERWLELTTHQHSVLHQQQYPLLVSGPPGSGKTVLLHAMFGEAALAHEKSGFPGALKLLYLTKSMPLAEMMRREWGSWARQHLRDDASRVVVDFLSFSDVHYHDESNDDAVWESLDKTRLCQDYLKPIMDSDRDGKINHAVEDVYHECILASKVLNDDLLATPDYQQSSYCKLGKRHSSMDESSKKQLFSLYQKLIKQLHRDKKYHYELSQIHSKDAVSKYDLVCIDEAQLVGTQALLNAYGMAKEGRVAYFADHNQRQNTHYSPLSLLGDLIYKKYDKKELHHQLLTTTHRLSLAASILCNRILALDSLLEGGVSDKKAYASIDVSELKGDLTGNEKDGFLRWLTSLDRPHIAELSTCATAAVVVFREEDKDEGSSLIGGNTNVFTVEESQGLQFSQVVVYLSQEVLMQFAPINQEMHKKGITSMTLLTPKAHLASATSDKWTDKQAMLSRLFVALSRSYQHLWVHVDEPSSPIERHRVHFFLNLLKTQCQEKNGEQVVDLVQHVSSQEEWLITIHQFLDNTNDKQAQQALMTHFRLNEEQAKVYVEFYRQQLPPNSAYDERQERCIAYLSQLRFTESKTERTLPPSPLAMNKVSAEIKASSSTKKEPPKSDLPLSKQKSIPTCLQNITDTSGIDVLVGVVLTLLTTKVHDAGYWICEYPLNNNCSLFSQIYSSYKNVVILNMKLCPEKQLTPFFKQIEPYFLTVPLGPDNNTLTHLHLLAGYNMLNPAGATALNPFLEGSLKNISAIQLNQEITIKEVIAGGSLLFYAAMLLHSDVLLTQVKKIMPEGLNRFVTTLRGREGSSPLFCLVSKQKICKPLIEDLIQNNKVREGLVQPITSLTAEQGKTPFYALCTTYEGRSLITAKWASFKDKMNSTQLHQVVTGDGPEKGMTPFYVLCGTPEGLTLITAQLDFFKNKMNNTQLHQVVTGDGSEKGKTPFYYLCGMPIGLALIAAQWGFFKDKINNTQLHQVVTGDGPDKGTTPFCFLCGTPEGRALITAQWEFFKDKINHTQLHQVVTGDGPDKGTTPFYFLCTSLEGCALIAAKWEFFKDKINHTQLHQVVTGDGPYKGMTPFYFLCTIPEGRTLITVQWEFFKNKMNNTQLHQVVTGDGLYKGKTPFYVLCGSPEGCALITAQWEFFKDKINHTQLHQVVTGDGPDKGKSPYDLLRSSRKGLALIEMHPDIFNQRVASHPVNSRGVFFQQVESTKTIGSSIGTDSKKSSPL